MDIRQQNVTLLALGGVVVALVNGKRVWLGQYATVAEAEQALKKWQER